MNEDLLELAYSKMETESSYEDFKKDFESDLNLQELVYSKFDTEASFEDFIKDVFGEVKKKDEAVSTSQEEQIPSFLEAFRYTNRAGRSWLIGIFSSKR